MAEYHLSDPAVVAFVLLPCAVVGSFVWAVNHAWRASGAPPAATRRAMRLAIVGSVAWMLVTGMAAQSGALRDWTRSPPPFAGLVLGVGLLSVALSGSTVGRRLAQHAPLWALVAVQAFRLPLEIAMHGLYERGLMPLQMSFSGRNFDIVTGGTAIIVSWLVATRRAGRAIVWAWNILGLVLVLNVVTIGVISTPRIQYFGSDHLNVFVTYFPFVWLPAILVTAAIAGHLIVFRALVLHRDGVRT
jgi:hypothetical protein